MRILTAAILAVVVFSLVSCGFDYCVAGIGTCSHEFANVPNTIYTSTPTPGGGLTFSGCNSATVRIGGNVICTVAGGSGTYTFTVTPTTCGNFNPVAGANATFNGQASGSCILNAVDTTNTSIVGSTSVTVVP